MTRLRSTAAAVLTTCSLAACGAGNGSSHTENAFQWRGPVAPGGWVRIRNLNGSVKVARAPGAEVVITASRTWRGRNPQDVQFVASPDPSGVTACALWSEDGECSAERYENGQQSRSWLARVLRRRAGVSVDYVVALPAGVRIDAQTTNGRVTIADASSDVVVNTVNGSVVVGASGGPIRAKSVNGSVRALLNGLATGGIALETVNGSVAALLPANANADVSLETTNGRVKSDFPLALQQGDRRSLRGTLGAGGQRVTLETVNGSATLGRL